MSEPPNVRPSAASKIWIAIRFIVFGIGGFIAVWISWMSVIFGVTDPHGEPFLLTPQAAVPVCFVAGLMMLFGGGQWGRWAYLWVFASVPIVVTPLGLLARAYPQFDSLFAKPLLIVFFAAPMPISYLLVRKYYRRRDAQRQSQ
jgi:hypothetical protein